MKIIFGAALILAISSISYAECTNEMEAFNNHQNVIKGMMDMNFEGKLNSENSKAIGERMKEGQQASENGDYAKACEIYDSIIEDYGMEKVFGVQQGQEDMKKEQKPKAAESSSSSEAAAEADASASPTGK